MTVAIVSSSILEKSVKRRLILINVLHLAAAEMTKTCFFCCYFYLMLSFASYGLLEI